MKAESFSQQLSRPCLAIAAYEVSETLHWHHAGETQARYGEVRRKLDALLWITVLWETTGSQAINPIWTWG